MADILKVRGLDNVFRDIPALVGPAGPQGEQGPAGEGIISGGTSGQVLMKNSNTDYDTKWGTLTASDIRATNAQTVQANLERIDEEIEDRQITYLITEYPSSLDSNALYRVEDAFTHESKTYEIGLYQVVDNDLELISTGSSLPSGGTTGQVLKKTSGIDYDVEWGDAGGGLLSNENCYYYVEGSIRLDSSIKSTDATLLNSLSDMMSDYYPKYLENSNQSATLFFQDNTGYSNGTSVIITRGGSYLTNEKEFFYEYPYKPSYPGSRGVRKLLLTGSWNATTNRYTITEAITQEVQYTPTSNYNPATKKYVDDSIASAITTTLGGDY